jgi:peptide/nickel transport system substrate-binding protein
MKSRNLVALVLVALLIGIVMPTVMAQDGEQVLNAAFGVGPGGYEDGRPWTGGAGHTTHIKMFVTPTIFNEDLTDIIPYAVESWEVSDDFTVWTYHLKDIMWSDGTPLTANDWKFTADFVAAADFDTDQLAHRALAFADAEGFDAAVAGEADELVGVQVVDDLTIQYTLSSPNPRHYANQYRTYILPQHAVNFEPSEQMTTDWYRNPETFVGSGPFVVEAYERDGYLTLGANANYFEGQPKLDKIVIRYFGGDITAAVLALAAGEIDFTYVDPTDLEVLGDGYDVFSNNSTVIVYLDINYNNVPEFWQDIRVRQAILHAIDREAITKQILQETYYSLPCPVPFPDLWPEDVDWYEYNPERAAELLAEAGVDPSDISIEFTGHAGYDNILHNSALQAVQVYLSQIGVDDMTYRFLDIPTFRTEYAADGPWTFEYRGWAYPIYGADPASKWDNSGSQGGDFKGYDMTASGLADAVVAIKQAPTTDDYFAAMTDFCGLHNELLPDIQLWVGNRYGAASQGITNFWWQPAGGGGPYYDSSYLWEMSGE